MRHSFIAAGLAAVFAAPAAAQQVTFMTGPQGGSWIPLGGALKGMWEKAVPGLQMTVTPGAGIANVRGVDEGKAHIGFANSSTTVDGIEGRALVRETGWVYPKMSRTPRTVQEVIRAFDRVKPKLRLTP